MRGHAAPAGHGGGRGFGEPVVGGRAGEESCEWECCDGGGAGRGAAGNAAVALVVAVVRQYRFGCHTTVRLVAGPSKYVKPVRLVSGDSAVGDGLVW